MQGKYNATLSFLGRCLGCRNRKSGWALNCCFLSVIFDKLHTHNEMDFHIAPALTEWTRLAGAFFSIIRWHVSPAIISSSHLACHSHHTLLKHPGRGLDKRGLEHKCWSRNHLLPHLPMAPPTTPIYTIPDLLISWPWARAKNPDLAAVQDDANAWVESLNLFKPPQLKKFKACEFSGFPRRLSVYWIT